MKLICGHCLLLCTLVATTLGKSVHPNRQDESIDWMHKYRPQANTHKSGSPRYEDADHWIQDGQSVLADKLGEHAIKKEAKNTIFYLGDGMSLATVTAARIYKGQREGAAYGEEAELFFDTFPNIGLSKTFCSDNQVADSACSATAYLSGVKANYATIGVKPSVLLKDCKGMMDVNQRTESILMWAQAAGKSTGVITTSRITDASPAGCFAHTAERGWENDAAVRRDGQDPDFCDDISEQLILSSPGQGINVILGGGRREFVPTTVQDPENPANFGKRMDGKNLIEMWQNIKAEEGARAQYVWNKEQFEAIDANQTDFLFGLFNHNEMDFVMDSDEEPSLPQMTKKAIEILSRNPNGYFLFVEGGRIDHAHHSNKAQKALMETIVFDEAVQMGVNMTSEEDTLIVVTADHAHVMTISGYPDRGNPIMGVADVSDMDGLPYTTLSYANGPGYRHPSVDGGDRYNITGYDFYERDYRQISTLPRDSESHGGDDVIIFSRGPFSHLLKGVVQQSYIPHVISYASCVGPMLKFCDQL